MNMEFDFFTHNINKMSYTHIHYIISELLIDILKNRSKLEFSISLLNKDKRKIVQNLSIKIINKIEKYDNEIMRVKALYEFDRSFGSFNFVAGVDEVGRGPLAGPIVTAAVILDLNNTIDSDIIIGINDSKKLSQKNREKLSLIIKDRALGFAIACIDNNSIDEKGISYCNNKAFIEACENLSIKPEMVLSDGYPIRNYNINNKAVIKGDTKSASIACASIIAKVYRDSLMYEYSNLYPQYGFASHVGYGTKEHIENIIRYGITPIHRKSFLRNMNIL